MMNDEKSVGGAMVAVERSDFRLQVRGDVCRVDFGPKPVSLQYALDLKHVVGDCVTNRCTVMKLVD